MIWLDGLIPAEHILLVTRGLFCACTTSSTEKAAAKALGFIGFLTNMGHKKPGRHHIVLRLFMTRFEVGDLVTLSLKEKRDLFNDTGYSPEEIREWKVGIVLGQANDEEAEDAYYRVKWFPSGDIIDEIGRMIVHMDKI